MDDMEDGRAKNSFDKTKWANRENTIVKSYTCYKKYSQVNNDTIKVIVKLCWVFYRIINSWWLYFS